MINARYVLTAAHCVQRKSHKFIQVVLGDHDWTDNYETRAFRSDVLQVISHPFFGSRTTFDNDFALLRLKTPVDWDRYPKISPACMPGRNKYIGKYNLFSCRALPTVALGKLVFLSSKNFNLCLSMFNVLGITQHFLALLSMAQHSSPILSIAQYLPPL